VAGTGWDPPARAAGTALLGLTAALGPSIQNVMIAIGFISSPAIARLTRAQTLSVRESEYVAAARVSGASSTAIVARHVWPNVTAPIIVQATLLVATAIVTEASLSFLGVGVQPPTPSWGSMLRTGSQYLEVAPWIAFAPGFAIFLTVLAFNFIGDGLHGAHAVAHSFALGQLRRNGSRLEAVEVVERGRVGIFDLVHHC
jgi:ABC-type dipeptide/oligopeptide/nickel transport system permease subunit